MRAPQCQAGLTGRSLPCPASCAHSDLATGALAASPPCRHCKQCKAPGPAGRCSAVLLHMGACVVLSPDIQLEVTGFEFSIQVAAATCPLDACTDSSEPSGGELHSVNLGRGLGKRRSELERSTRRTQTCTATEGLGTEMSRLTEVPTRRLRHSPSTIMP